jgi:hypothetical protein
VVGSPTEVYERIARGALSCWFGRAGPLKADYVYHAQAQPAGKGGNAEIVIHERDRTSDNPKGLRAWRLGIERQKDTTTLAVENLKLPEPLSASMQADAHRWAAGNVGCTEEKLPGWSEDALTRPPEGGSAGKAKP